MNAAPRLEDITRYLLSRKQQLMSCRISDGLSVFDGKAAKKAGDLTPVRNYFSGENEVHPTAHYRASQSAFICAATFARSFFPSSVSATSPFSANASEKALANTSGLFSTRRSRYTQIWRK